jgi:Protein tyrosine and serine/threonine kinase
VPSSAKQVAIKRLDRRGMQGDKEFGMEASMLCSLKHANIVTLRGVCVEGDNRCTIFDLAANVRLSMLSHVPTSSTMLRVACTVTISFLQVLSQHHITRR